MIVRVGDGMLQKLFVYVQYIDACNRQVYWRSLTKHLALIFSPEVCYIRSSWATEIVINVRFTFFFQIVTSDLKKFQFNCEEAVEEEDKVYEKAKFLEVKFFDR